MRHGCHDVFWCYPFEREVSNFVNIRSNQLNSEVTFSDFFARYWFTKMYKLVEVDGDGLFPESRALMDVHKYLQTPSEAQRITLMRSPLICEQWHESCVIVVPSSDIALQIWKLITLLPPHCVCKELIQKKGILVGRKNGMVTAIPEPTNIYLQRYWRLHGFNNGLLPFFNTRIQLFFSLMLHGQLFRKDDFVIIDPDVAVGGHAWRWKAKVTQFLVHEFHGMKQVFFSGDYYATVPTPSSVHVALEHELTCMTVIKEDAQRWQECGDNIRVVSSLMYKFLPLPTCGQTLPSFVAYELEDVDLREHLFSDGRPGCVPPYPEKGDVMLVRAMNWRREKPTFAIAVVRNVTPQRYLLDVEGETSKRNDIAKQTDLEEQDYFVGEVILEWLQGVGRPNSRPQKLKCSGSKCTKSWHCLVTHLTNYKATRVRNGEPCVWILSQGKLCPCNIFLIMCVVLVKFCGHC